MEASRRWSFDPETAFRRLASSRVSVGTGVRVYLCEQTPVVAASVTTSLDSTRLWRNPVPCAASVRDARDGARGTGSPPAIRDPPGPVSPHPARSSRTSVRHGHRFAPRHQRPSTRHRPRRGRRARLRPEPSRHVPTQPQQLVTLLVCEYQFRLRSAHFSWTDKPRYNSMHFVDRTLDGRPSTDSSATCTRHTDSK